MKKEITAITEILNDFLKPFDCVSNFGETFGFYSISNTVEFALTVKDVHDKTFMDFVTKRYPDIRADIFLWSFLHEVGHHETENDFDDDEWENYMRAIFNCEDDMEYYHLSIECAATDWAGNYMRTHTDEVSALWKKLQPAIMNFYKSF